MQHCKRDVIDHQLQEYRLALRSKNGNIYRSFALSGGGVYGTLHWSIGTRSTEMGIPSNGCRNSYGYSSERKTPINFLCSCLVFVIGRGETLPTGKHIVFIVAEWTFFHFRNIAEKIQTMPGKACGNI